VHELYREVHRKADFRPCELRPEYFPALQQAVGERMRCSAIWRGDEMLGFLITLADGETAYAYHIGFDREAAAGLPVYLRLLHAGISDAIALGCRRVSFGRTALEAKAALGAKPESFGVMLR
ncbi:GNAT family N-acetyltransferase, partial [Shewanella sp. A3A]|nr:GNAT family N-acetyltransferase [Shewanella ferrihydritica]